MKKTIKIIAILVLIAMMFFPINSYAASLDSLTVDVDKTTVRPGEEVTLTINFGEALGAYTFDIAYDNNIFEYVSVSEGTANDNSNNVRVTFYDSTGGTNPSNSMSIIFKAKDDITTSNPTELTVTGEGLSNSDASVTYDDIVTPIVKNITVEPEYKDYDINLEYTGDILAGEEKEMVLSYSSAMGHYYANARLIAEATTPADSNVKLIAVDENQGEEDIIQSGWGDPQGYEIGGKDFLQKLNVTGIFSNAGDYSITLKLIDRGDSDNVIAEKTFSFTVAEKPAEVTPPTTEEKPPVQEPSDEIIDDVIDETTKEETPAQTEKVEENVTTDEAKPTILPKTGINIYIPITVLIIGLAGFIVYYNRKKSK